MLICIISTHRSQKYTIPSIASLTKKTHFRAEDRIIVIDNDNTLEDIAGVEIIRNMTPRSFAQNANFAISVSHLLKDDLILTNNDIIYTNHWRELLYHDIDKIFVPFSNQDAQYQIHGLDFKFAMDLEDFNDADGTLEQIALHHRGRVAGGNNHVKDILIPFFCVLIPWRISKAVGYFDENFGRGGGEDIDYRLRAELLGFDVVKSRQSLLLHFMGKSTWRSNEAIIDTQAADAAYRNYFIRKWGTPLASFFLAGRGAAGVIAEHNLHELVENQDYREIIRRLRTLP